jgi:carboxyl-terminal processing protease
VVQLKQRLDAQHVAPKEWNEQLYSEIAAQLVYLLDPSGLYFTAAEAEEIARQTALVARSFQTDDCRFVEDITLKYKKALDRADITLKRLQNESLAFNGRDSLTVYFNPMYVETEAALENKWRQLITFDLLRERIMLNEAASAPPESKSQAKVCSKYADIIRRRQSPAEGIEYVVFYRYMNAVATTFDPHSQYFSTKDSELYLEHLMSEGQSYGIHLSEDALGNVCVGRIIPGSSAWESRSVNEGDFVLSIRQAKADPIDATLYSGDELEEMMTKMTEPIELRIRKLSGEEESVNLIKRAVEQDENKIISLLIASGGLTFGYVYLPVFYAADDGSASGCANDLALEILNLKKAGIAGLILDVRDNGGGSLYEALALAGIFVDRGALAIQAERGKEPETLRDMNAGTVYDGPLVVMMNGGSASASELFAMAMRDHNRAILVGTDTYGKGTGQAFIPFTGDGGDMIKITTFRFYDVKGKSHQGHGVQPDILLPHRLTAIQEKEEKARHVLQAEAITKKTYYTPLPPLPLGVLRDSSQQRISRSDYFKKENHLTDKLRHYAKPDGLRLPLNLTGLRAFYALLQDGEGEVLLDDVQMTKHNQQITTVDKYGLETYSAFIDAVKSDQQIAEVVNILIDWKRIEK